MGLKNQQILISFSRAHWSSLWQFTNHITYAHHQMNCCNSEYDVPFPKQNLAQEVEQKRKAQFETNHPQKLSYHAQIHLQSPHFPFRAFTNASILFQKHETQKCHSKFPNYSKPNLDLAF